MATHLGWGEAKVEEGNAAHAAAAHTLLNAWVTNTPITGKLGENLSAKPSFIFSHPYSLWKCHLERILHGGMMPSGPPALQPSTNTIICICRLANLFL